MRQLLLVSACLLASACATALPPPSPTPAPTATERVTLRIVSLGNGLVADIPVGWEVAGLANVNRVMQRQLLAGNGDLTSLPTVPNGDLDPSALPAGRVVVDVETFCGLSCSGPQEETTLPLDWGAAVPFRAGALPAGRHALAISFRWFDRSQYFVARWADDAPAADVAAIADIARSIRPDVTPPMFGEYNGWDGLGSLADIPVGSVRLTPLPAGAMVRPPYRLYDNVPFFLVRGKLNVYAFVSRPLQDQRCEISYVAATDHFACTVGPRTYEWTHFGRYLGPEPSSDLSQHQVIVRAGRVWVYYVEDSLLVPSVRDEAAER